MTPLLDFAIWAALIIIWLELREVSETAKRIAAALEAANDEEEG